MARKLSTEEFIEKAKKVHGDKFDYSLVEYKNNRTKVKIICPKHGIFNQKPNCHVDMKNGCPKCRYIKSAESNSYSTEEFIEKAKKVHGDKFDYSLVEYKRSQEKVKIICPKHGIFQQRPQDHLRYDCNKCSYEKDRKRKIVLSTEEFIEKAKKVHGDKFDYSLVEYAGGAKKVKIICDTHGLFEQIPNDHLKGIGCKYCASSKAESDIALFFEENDIKFERQKRFDECRYKLPLPFDFFLPGYNILLEYDGIHHFKPIEYWGGKTYLKEVKVKDAIKDLFCEENKLKLIRISYKQDLIKELAELREDLQWE